MAKMFGALRAPIRAASPLLTIIVLVAVAAPLGGCLQGPRFQAPFTLANPNQRHPIAVSQSEATLDLAVPPGARGLNRTQQMQLHAFLREYHNQGGEQLLIRAPSGGSNETAAMRAYEDVRRGLRGAGINKNAVVLEPYFANMDPSAPLRLSYLAYVAKAPDCVDWSEDLGRDPQNMPYPNLGCATQRNFAVAVANPQDLLGPRAETPRPGERRDVVWGKYVKGDITGSIWAPDEKPISERANASEIAPTGGGQ